MASNAMAGYTDARPDLRLLFFDGVSKWNEILNDPIRFGFTNITDSALGQVLYGSRGAISKLGLLPRDYQGAFADGAVEF